MLPEDEERFKKEGKKLLGNRSKEPNEAEKVVHEMAKKKVHELVRQKQQAGTEAALHVSSKPSDDLAKLRQRQQLILMRVETKMMALMENEAAIDSSSSETLAGAAVSVGAEAALMENEAGTYSSSLKTLRARLSRWARSRKQAMSQQPRPPRTVGL